MVSERFIIQITITVGAQQVLSFSLFGIAWIHRHTRTKLAMRHARAWIVPRVNARVGLISQVHLRGIFWSGRSWSFVESVGPLSPI